MLRGTLTITVIVFLLTLAVSGLAAEVPKELLGTWSSNKSICDGDAGPDEAEIYEIGPKDINYWETGCLIQDVNKLAPDKVDFNLDCFGEGNARYFDKLRVQRLSRGRLSLTFPKRSHSAALVYRCSQKAPEPERLPGEKVTKWTHNDSIVSFTETDSYGAKSLVINYVQPRPGLMPVGVRQGTMLFHGGRTGEEIEGQAWIFHRQCGPLEYGVRGELLDGGNLVVLTGLKPKVNSKCESIGKVADTLRFERIR